MENNIKIMVETLIKEGVDMDLILKASGLAAKEIEEISPIAYGRYVGARKKLLEIAYRMIDLGYKTNEIVKVTGMINSKVEELKTKTKNKK
ncbi:protein of unknown function (plasmid) [Cardinium endosymbiont cEper1 of Encarsia pergandiella]|uniref:hypothetical protein n=1 Tax=Cardinium endosymbiont of Encarsia pergandiella TaxID=249402 RepID=UPI00027E9E23|nr:hypothetical protein [Cardinium endosymbiont of Encarsia pergandiella]CCM10655.1 protein of unknown function [Cardinium endosymbiont cEper1 of Encarsia pergandiella]